MSRRNIPRIMNATVLIILTAFIASCNHIKKPKSVININSIKLYAPIKLYLLKYDTGNYVSLDFKQSLEVVNRSILKINSLTPELSQYYLWRQKITGVDSSKLLKDDIRCRNNNLKYYFKLKSELDTQNTPPAEVKRKVLEDAFFINNGFGFYSSLWYLNPFLKVEQGSYHRLIDKSNLFNLALTGWSDDMTDLTANWIEREDKDGLPLNIFRTVNPGLAKKLKNELESKFLGDKETKNPNFQLVDDFLTKEVNGQAIILIEYSE